jgi:hypothetical protein
MLVYNTGERLVWITHMQIICILIQIFAKKSCCTMNFPVFSFLFKGNNSLLLFCFNLLIEISLYSKHVCTVICGSCFLLGRSSQYTKY